MSILFLTSAWIWRIQLIPWPWLIPRHQNSYSPLFLLHQCRCQHSEKDKCHFSVVKKITISQCPWKGLEDLLWVCRSQESSSQVSDYQLRNELNWATIFQSSYTDVLEDKSISYGPGLPIDLRDYSTLLHTSMLCGSSNTEHLFLSLVSIISFPWTNSMYSPILPIPIPTQFLLNLFFFNLMV